MREDAHRTYIVAAGRPFPDTPHALRWNDPARCRRLTDEAPSRVRRAVRREPVTA
jgi:hypothetical protein